MDFIKLEQLTSQILGTDISDDIFFSANNKHADLSTNVLFIMSKKNNKKPIEAFEDVKSKLKNDYIEEVSMARNGFLNIKLSNKFLTEGFQHLIDSDNPGKSQANNIKVNVEFVSANPTGPLHYGNARSVYGDALANILQFAGYDVTKEYYVNDAGNQINLLADSVFSAYLELQNLPPMKLDEMYRGDYIKDIAKEIYETSENKWNESNYQQHFKEVSIKHVIELIKDDLKSVGIKHNVWTYESEILHHAPKAFEILKQKGLIYQGKLGTIQSNKGEESGATLTLFKSSQFGDSEDRALTKPNGEHTYFANDIAYFYDKILRKFKWLIIVLGADHDGYLKRLNSAVSNLDPTVKLDMKTCQVVLFQKDGEIIKLSKRSGNALGLKEAAEQIGKDMFRFLMLSKSLDTHYTVQTDKIVELSMENPFFYVQYAHARICSILKAHDVNLEEKIDIKNLTPSMIQLLKILLEWTKCIQSVVRTLEVHKIINYLMQVSEQFHSIWNDGKMNPENRWIVANQQITNNRLILAVVTKKLIHEALQLLGVQAYNEL